MPLVGLPCAAVTVKRLRFMTLTACGAEQFPDACRVCNNAVQRAALKLAALTGFEAGSNGFGHVLAVLVQVNKSVKPADKPDFVR